MTPYQKYQKRMADLEKKLEKWLADNRMTQTQLARKLGIEPPLLTYHKIKYKTESKHKEELPWPPKLVKGIVKITKGEISRSDFNLY